VTITTQERPQRWDEPFGSLMTDADVERLFKVPGIEENKFPSHCSLKGILKNDARIIKYSAGDIVIREGDYGNSAFLVLGGTLKVVLFPGLPADLLGRTTLKKKTFWQALKQLWGYRKFPEVRNAKKIEGEPLVREGQEPGIAQVFLQDVPTVLDQNKTASLGKGALFGELAALGRTPRTATIFAETGAELLEIRWQGLRELRKYDEGWRRIIDERYRKNALTAHLRATSIFSHLEDDELQKVSDATLFETYGQFDWHLTYNKLQNQDKISGSKDEPTIVRQGDYADGVLLVRGGFARVSVNRGNGQQTITYLGAGDFYGVDEIYRNWKGEANVGMRVTISAIGYTELLRVPSKIVEKHLFEEWGKQGKAERSTKKTYKSSRRLQDSIDRTLSDGALLEWAVSERLVNGTQAMLINLDSCVRCDDCVSACAAAHDGNPRFIRHGKTFENWMVANACMHCADPVCMIGCPTGAIHRSMSGGMVIINDDTCIGCETCANSCPYSNIRMVSINDNEGHLITDLQNQKPILKATKCDLCADQVTGPACVYACPQDALKRVNFQEIGFDEQTTGF
jgi:Fe-S-cluster-containing dehydrogenase component/CRP-like cAMP-binding protein